MPTLDWIGKKAVINHHKKVPFHLLKCDPDLSVGDPESGNLLVQGDNLLALKALLPYYVGRVKCIYIDPPYNTGNEKWVYNDNVNSPEIKEWLGNVVGMESEDLSRHDKWLCMMFPRLRLLKNFLKNDGALFVSIDENEVNNLKIVCDEIFGANNFVTILSWQKRVSPANDAKYFSSDHEFVVVYAKNKNDWRPFKLERTEKQLKNYRNPDEDPRGPWNSVTYTCNKSVDERPNLYHAIVNPHTGKEIWPRRTAVWKYDAERHRKNENEGLVYWGVDGKAKMPRLKRFLSDMGKVVPRSVLPYSDCGHTQEARSEILNIIEEVPFTTPKPVRLIEHLLKIGSDENSLILDSFAGSGTTGHAVLSLNKFNDKSKRKFILVEMDGEICADIAAKRIKRAVEGFVAKGHKGKIGPVDGLGGGFQYCHLGQTLFDAYGQINKTVSFIDLARFAYFRATGQPLPDDVSANTPLIGIHNGTAIYLLYNGILKDKTPQGGNALTRVVLDALPPHNGPKVVFGTSCRVGAARLKVEKITFRQIPYELRVD